MKAGRELDALVAEKVLQHRIWICEHCDSDDQWDCAYRSTRSEFLTRAEAQFFADTHIRKKSQPSWYAPSVYLSSALKNYSTDIAAAWDVVEKLRSMGKSVSLYNRATKHGEVEPFGCEIENGTYQGEPATWFSDWQESAPHAICLAALSACGVKL